MKKVLSAVVLSAAVVATAGQAHAFGNFSLTQCFYDSNEKLEIAVDHGAFLTSAALTAQNVTLNIVDYNSIKAAYTGAGSLKTGYFLDGIVSTQPSDLFYNVYFVTTTSDAVNATLNSSRYTNFNSSANTLAAQYNNAGSFVGDTVVDLPFVAAADAMTRYTSLMNSNSTPGSYSGTNRTPDFGEIDIDSMTGDYQDVYLWHVQYNKNKFNNVTIGSKLIEADGTVYDGVGQAYTAVIRFNKSTGESTLNPVPVPAAAWLLGSGLLGLFGLRRRK